MFKIFLLGVLQSEWSTREEADLEAQRLYDEGERDIALQLPDTDE